METGPIKVQQKSLVIVQCWGCNVCKHGSFDMEVDYCDDDDVDGDRMTKYK